MIGVFDSGFGGLHVLKSIVKRLPRYDFCYLGDSARAPYGSRSPEVVHAFTREAVDFLFREGCELIILACNTASSDALRAIQQDYLPKHHPNKRVLGVLIPAAEAAHMLSKNRRIGVLATEGTVQSGAFPRELAKLDPTIHVLQQAAPMLVPLIEAGEHQAPATFSFLQKYLQPLLDAKIDALILGCTHYGILEHDIQKIVGPTVALVSESDILPEKLHTYLAKHSKIEKQLQKNSRIRFLSTDPTFNFQELGSDLYGERIEVEKVVMSGIS